MTCPVMRVANVGDGEAEVDQVVAGIEKWGVMANLQSEVVDDDDVMPTLEDQQMVGR